MADWVCGRCRAQVAPGAPRCPECPSTEFIRTEAEADGMPKIDRNGRVSYEADAAAKPFFERLADVNAVVAEANTGESAEAAEHPGTGVPMEGIEHPADGTMSPPVSNDAPPAAEPVPVVPEPDPAPPVPAPPARTPPRRAAPPGAAGD